jgi:8-oxo-dGTP pyrophosphatase MutT (NUDIX family)
VPGAERRPHPRVPSEVSAGGVVVRGQEVIAIVPTRRAADGSSVLALPKGHMDDGETPLQAAIREVREEAGVVVEHLADLGEVRYWYTRKGQRIAKAVQFFLFGYVEGDIADHDDEVQEVRWIPLGEAQQTLSYPGEREMVGRAIALLARKDR